LEYLKGGSTSDGRGQSNQYIIAVVLSIPWRLRCHFYLVGDPFFSPGKKVVIVHARAACALV